MSKLKPSNKNRSLPPDDIKFIINSLRQASVKWPGRKETLDRARKRVCEGRTKKGKKIWKYYWQCVHCEQWFRDESAVQVDHVVEIGPFLGDWNEFLARMFLDDRQVLCVVCHMRKTNAFNAAHLKWKRKRPAD